jgi:hypothetical protein
VFIVRVTLMLIRTWRMAETGAARVWTRMRRSPVEVVCSSAVCTQITCRAHTTGPSEPSRVRQDQSGRLVPNRGVPDPSGSEAPSLEIWRTKVSTTSCVRLWSGYGLLSSARMSSCP